MPVGVWVPLETDGEPSPFFYQGAPAQIVEGIFGEDHKPTGFRLRVGPEVVEIMADAKGEFPGMAFNDGKPTVN